LSEASFRGGATVGWINVSWPLAKLAVSQDRLAISASQKLEFEPSQVVSIEPQVIVPALVSGISIEHNRLDYPKTVVFHCIGNRDKVLSAIAQAGFVPTGQPIARPEGFPVRWSAVAIIVLVWNALMLWSIPSMRAVTSPLIAGLAQIAALLSVFVFASVLPRFPGLQDLVLAPGHQVGEIKGLLSFLQLLSGLMLLVFGTLYFLK
jgi:hypothetical protein